MRKIVWGGKAAPEGVGLLIIHARHTRRHRVSECLTLYLSLAVNGEDATALN